jgi:hypothetical protein
MENMAGVDVISTIFTFKTLNTRGFNVSYNPCFIQRYDDVDLSMPGFNLSLGVLNGPLDIDVERVELIPRVNSALHGANAINGKPTALCEQGTQRWLACEDKIYLVQTQHSIAPLPKININLLQFGKKQFGYSGFYINLNNRLDADKK